MATKSEILAALARGEGPLGTAADDEPVFVLRGRDLSAPVAIRVWVADARQRAVPQTKYASALAVAKDMEAYVRKHGSKRPD